MKKSAILFSFLIFTVTLSAQSYNDWVERSFGFMEANDLDNAEESLKSALRLEPANPQNCLLLSNLGTIQRQQGKPEDALLSYSSALMLMPKSILLLGNRAALYSELEKWDEAEADYTTILYLEQDHEESLYRRGVIRLQRGDTLAARTDFERILKSSATSWRGRMGVASMLKASGDYVMAAEMYSQIIKANDKNAELFLRRAEVYYLDNKLSKAANDINRSIELDTEDPLAYVVRGRIRFAQYDKISALKDYETAAEMGFKDPILRELIQKCR